MSKAGYTYFFPGFTALLALPHIQLSPFLAGFSIWTTWIVLYNPTVLSCLSRMSQKLRIYAASIDDIC